MGIVVYSLLGVTQDLYHQPYHDDSVPGPEPVGPKPKPKPSPSSACLVDPLQGHATFVQHRLGRQPHLEAREALGKYQPLNPKP